eukprot:4007068-Amphidinium_carterae.1
MCDLPGRSLSSRCFIASLQTIAGQVVDGLSRTAITALEIYTFVKELCYLLVRISAPSESAPSALSVSPSLKFSLQPAENMNTLAQPECSTRDSMATLKIIMPGLMCFHHPHSVLDLPQQIGCICVACSIESVACV